MRPVPVGGRAYGEGVDPALQALLVDVITGLPDSTVTVADSGTIVTKLADGTQFFVRTAR